MFEHLDDVCMTYLQHMIFSLYLSYRFIVASFAAVIHAILPCCFVTHSSSMIESIQKEMKQIGCRENDNAENDKRENDEISQ